MTTLKEFDTEFLLLLEPAIDIATSKDVIKLGKHTQETSIAVICSVDTAAGKPNFTMVYRSRDGESIGAMAYKPVLVNKNHYIQGSQRADLVVSKSGQIFCHVFDKRGTYVATKRIGVGGMLILGNCIVTTQQRHQNNNNDDDEDGDDSDVIDDNDDDYDDMMWRDVRWRDVTWHDMTWYDEFIWYGMIWYGLIWMRYMMWYMRWYMIWHGMTWRDMIWHDKQDLERANG